MSSTHKPAYASVSALTISPASLASSATFVAGRESTAVDNSSNLYDDVILSGKITVGATPTPNTQILISVFSTLDDSPTWPDVMDGTDSAETLTSVGVGQGFLKLAAALNVDSNTSNRAYDFNGISVANLFGGTMPKRWGVFIAHNTGVALHATGGNHVINAQGVNGQLV